MKTQKTSSAQFPPYIHPEITIIDISVEAGFAVSDQSFPGGDARPLDYNSDSWVSNDGE